MAACGDDIFQSLIQVRRGVEGAVKRRLQRSGQFDEGAGALDVDGAIGVEDTEDDSAGSELESMLKVLADGVEGGCGVVEAVGVGAQDDMDRKAALLDDRGDEVAIGGEAAYVEGGAEFDAVGSTGPGGEAGVQGFGTKFKDNDGSVQSFMDSSGFLGAIRENVSCTLDLCSRIQEKIEKMNISY